MKSSSSQTNIKLKLKKSAIILRRGKSAEVSIVKSKGVKAKKKRESFAVKKTPTI